MLLVEDIGGVTYAELGIGESKSKTRRQAATKIAAASNLLVWLEQHYRDKIL